MKRNQKGFTLMEMLIVVAIIAILIAISIPIFTTQLEKARDATDQANERAAKAVAVASYLTEPTTAAGTYWYDAAKGTLSTAATGITAYGKSTTAAANSTWTNDGNHDGMCITVVIDAAGLVTIVWGTPT